MAWNRTSATQHQAFLDCKRFWYYGYILRYDRGTSDALQKGIAIHNESEHYLKTGVIRPSDYEKYVEALKAHFPPAQHPELLVEHFFSIPAAAGVDWVGKIDIGFSGDSLLKLHDIKTTSNFRWAKTKNELRDNIQMISYARAAYESFDYDGDIELAHLYVKTMKSKKPRKKPPTKVVDVVVDQGHVASIWEREMETVQEMAETACAGSELDVEPTGVETGYCTKFSGCPFSGVCPRPKASAMSGVFKTHTQKGPTIVGLLERLKNKQESEGKAPTGIVPDDAPSRETPIETKTEAKEPEEKVEANDKPKKRGRPKGSSKKASKKTSTDQNGFVLYIGCMPVKNGDEVSPTLIEDWLGPIIEDLNAQVEEEHGLPDYRLLEYHAPKIAFEQAVGAKLGTLPPAMVVTNYSDITRQALTLIQPKASLVIQSVR